MRQAVKHRESRAGFRKSPSLLSTAFAVCIDLQHESEGIINANGRRHHSWYPCDDRYCMVYPATHCGLGDPDQSGQARLAQPDPGA